LSELLEENRTLLNAQAENKKINIVNSYTDSVPVNTHKHSINTVIRNLISNSIKFTPEGGTITTDIKKENEFVVVSIADSGVGMSKEVMEKLFRIDAKHSTKGTANEKGTGLGLILCKEFVEKNGGKIWVTSEEEKGSVFSFSIPMM
jgi:signal transduction histidine kinase